GPSRRPPRSRGRAAAAPRGVARDRRPARCREGPRRAALRRMLPRDRAGDAGRALPVTPRTRGFRGNDRRAVGQVIPDPRLRLGSKRNREHDGSGGGCDGRAAASRAGAANKARIFSPDPIGPGGTKSVAPASPAATCRWGVFPNAPLSLLDQPKTQSWVGSTPSP